MTPPFRTRRIYDPAEPEDGARVLIMRRWPRGIRKDRVTVWLKELGPVPALLRDFLDKRITWDEYVPRYLAGLERPEAQAQLAQVRALAQDGAVTLLCGCADETHCHRSLLETYLLHSAATSHNRPAARKESSACPPRRRARPRP